MDPVTIGVMAGLGLAKSELVDRPREEEQRRRAAVTARWSPWTGMAPGAVQEANPLGSAMEAGLTGAALSQQQQKLDNEALKNKPQLSLAGGSGQTAPWQMMEMQNQSVDPMMQRKMMYRSYE
jgi:hypothetical protein